MLFQFDWPFFEPSASILSYLGILVAGDVSDFRIFSGIAFLSFFHFLQNLQG